MDVPWLGRLIFFSGDVNGQRVPKKKNIFNGRMEMFFTKQW